MKMMMMHWFARSWMYRVHYATAFTSAQPQTVAWCTK